MVTMYKILLLSFLLVGCMGEIENAETSTTPIVDACLQKVYFDDCMKALPAGPTSTKYNDWSEVIDECTDSAKSLSYRQTKNVKDECKSGFSY